MQTGGSKKWVATSSGSSKLLRYPSSLKGATAQDDKLSSRRAQTCPGSRLTPELHWNLNNATLKTLSKAQVEQLCHLFKFYDSSTLGDALPSINCTRFMEILRDAQLLTDCSADSEDEYVAATSTKQLQADQMERVFAQAVMGKMRVHLDADDQPVLTFSLFCGALVHCAMLLDPAARPEAALQRIVPILLESSSVRGHGVSATKGLLSHLPSDSTMSLWTPKGACILHPQSDDAPQDFRELASFQQVIADCTRDKLLEELKQERVERHYQIPDHIVASFHPDTIALISDKFHMFDAFDRGTLPRHEVFALLSSLGAHLDLPEPYAVVAKLSTYNTLPLQQSESNSTIGQTSSGELTLAQLLQVIEAARETKRNSATAKLTAMKVHMDRAVLAARTSLLSKASQLETIAPDESDNVATAQKTKRTSTSGPRGRRNGTAILKSRKSTLSQGTGSVVDTAVMNNNRRGSTSMRNASISDRKRSLLHRKPSTVSGKSGASDRRYEGPQPAQLSASMACADTAVEVHENDETKVLECLADTARDTQAGYPSNGIMVQIHEPPSANNSKTIRIFLLLGGDHDGAVCYTISLVFATKEIMEKEGVYYSAASSETTRMTPVLPVHKCLTNALRILKKCVMAKVKEGFELLPPDQLNVVDQMLVDISRRQPHYSSPVTRKPRSCEERNRKTSSLQTAVSEFGRKPLPPRLKSAPPSTCRLLHNRQSNFSSDSNNVFAVWQASQRSNHVWIHDVNSASPLKLATRLTQPKLFRGSQLSPLRDLSSYNNQHMEDPNSLAAGFNQLAFKA